MYVLAYKLSKICKLSNPKQQGFVSKRCKNEAKTQRVLFVEPENLPDFVGILWSPKKNLLVNLKAIRYGSSFRENFFGTCHPCQPGHHSLKPCDEQLVGSTHMEATRVVGQKKHQRYK